MARKKLTNKNFDLYSGYGYFTPGIRDLVILVVWFLVGVLLANVISVVLAAVLGSGFSSTYILLVCYPLMFIPAMIYCSFKSHRNALFEEEVPLNKGHFGKLGGFFCALLAAIATLSTNMVADYIVSFMPQMPEWIAKALESATQGSFLVNFISVSIFAPLFEEWLCRGEVLRGLLNFKREDGTRGIKPVWAIVISSVFFAVIHANPWQAIPAFLLGSVFGYVYYKTGSLWLTMLMHFVNNTFALILSRIPAFKDVESFSDIMDPKFYLISVIACALLSILIVRKFATIGKTEPEQESE